MTPANVDQSPPEFLRRGDDRPHVLAAREDAVTARDLLLFLWRTRWLAALAGCICAIAAIITAFAVTPEYTAHVELLPVSSRNESLGSLGALVSAGSGLGGLASLAGLSLGGAGGQTTATLATLQSKVLTYRFIRENNLLPILYAKEWNPILKRWKSTDREKIPTLWKANRLFEKKIRSVDDDEKTGLVTLTIRWKNPQQAAQWANGLVEMTNDFLRQQAIEEAQRNIKYLDQQIAGTNIVEVKNAIYGLLESEIKKEMVARGRNEFALRVIDPAVPPENKSFPRPILWTVGAFLGGVFLGLLW
ncbi:MAG: hypothetical protein HIU85_20035, partial [Proteobacteria bacterium]|nr:hypothetical protein [Pseudomonadota bacterium]